MLTNSISSEPNRLRRNLLAIGGSLLTGYGTTATGASALDLLYGGVANIRDPKFEGGAKGDGVTDDTKAIQAAHDSLPNGGTIIYPPSSGAYMVDGNYQPTRSQYGGIKPKSNQHIKLDGCEVKALPSRHGESSVFNLHDVSNVRISGGRITGEKSTHIGNGGEWGHGISLWSATNIVIDGCEISDCWGDSIYLGSSGRNGNTYCDNVTIMHTNLHDSRRQGISVIAGKNIRIINNFIHDIGGTAPQACIDLEPDNGAYPNQNITIDSNRLLNGEVGVCSIVGNTKIEITNNIIECRAYTILIGGNAKDLRILGNTLMTTKVDKQGLNYLPQNGVTVDGVLISKNQFVGSVAGSFLLDFPGNGYKNLTVRDNEFKVSGTGLRAVRINSGGVFQNNIIVFDGAGGVKNDYFIALRDGCILGGNKYRNNTGNVMYSLITNATEAYPDSYLSATLRRGSLSGPRGKVSGRF